MDSCGRLRTQKQHWANTALPSDSQVKREAFATHSGKQLPSLLRLERVPQVVPQLLDPMLQNALIFRSVKIPMRKILEWIKTPIQPQHPMLVSKMDYLRMLLKFAVRKPPRLWLSASLHPSALLAPAGFTFSNLEWA